MVKTGLFLLFLLQSGCLINTNDSLSIKQELKFKNQDMTEYEDYLNNNKNDDKLYCSELIEIIGSEMELPIHCKILNIYKGYPDPDINDKLIEKQENTKEYM